MTAVNRNVISKAEDLNKQVKTLSAYWLKVLASSTIFPSRSNNTAFSRRLRHFLNFGSSFTTIEVSAVLAVGSPKRL